jgi:DNA-binding beta-propeller fold protein YncE
MALATQNRTSSAARRTSVIIAAAAAAVTMSAALAACTPNERNAKAANGSAHTEMAYVLTVANTVVPIRLPQGVAGRPVKIPGSPVDLAVTHDGKTVYVVSSTQSQPSNPSPPPGIDLSSFRHSSAGPSSPGLVTPINTGTGRAGPPIPISVAPLGPPPGAPSDVIITPDDKTVYVLGYNSSHQGVLSVISTRTNIVTYSIPTGYNSADMAITPNGNTIYVIGTGKSSDPADSGYALPISTRTNTAGQPVKVGPTAHAIAITADGRLAFVTDSGNVRPGSASITPIRLSDNTAESAIRGGNAVESYDSVVTSTRGSTAYALTGRHVIPIVGTPSRLGREIQVDGVPIDAAFSPDGKTAYFAVAAIDTSVIPFRVSTNTFEKPIFIGHDAQGMALSRDGSMLYVLDSDVSSIIPVNTSTDKTGPPITLSDAPNIIVIG